MSKYSITHRDYHVPPSQSIFWKWRLLWRYSTSNQYLLSDNNLDSIKEEDKFSHLSTFLGLLFYTVQPNLSGGWEGSLWSRDRQSVECRMNFSSTILTSSGLCLVSWNKLTKPPFLKFLPLSESFLSSKKMYNNSLTHCENNVVHYHFITNASQVKDFLMLTHPASQGRNGRLKLLPMHKRS